MGGREAKMVFRNMFNLVFNGRLNGAARADRATLFSILWETLRYYWSGNADEMTFFTRPNITAVDKAYNREHWSTCDIEVCQPHAHLDRHADWKHTFYFNKFNARQHHILTGIFAAFKHCDNMFNNCQVHQHQHFHDVIYFLDPCPSHHLIPYCPEGVDSPIQTPTAYISGYEYYGLTGTYLLPWQYGTIRVSKKEDEAGGY